jgi:hypothetical protein
MKIDYITQYKWAFIASLCTALSITMVKLYDMHDHYLFLLVSLLCQFGLVFSYLQLLRTADILTMFTFIKIVAIIMVVFIGILFFHSKLTVKKTIGILIGMLAIYLID